MPEIVIEASEPHTQSTRKCGLRVTGIRRRLQMSITQYNSDRAPPAEPNKRRHDNNQAGGDSSGNIVRNVIKASGGPTEKKVSVIFVAHYGVHRIHCFVGNHAGNAEHRQIEQRRNDGITHVLSNGFKDCASDILVGEMTCVAANEIADELSSTMQIAVPQRRDNFV